MMVNTAKGEWRCRCRPDPTFDKSINPVYVLRCLACGAERPKEITKCEHINRKPWDCYCTYGPPSCSSCSIKSQCVDCGELLKTAPSPPSRHRPPDFFDCHGLPRYVCECGTVEGLHEFGRHPQCEYNNHHCDACHARGACTAHEIDE